MNRLQPVSRIRKRAPNDHAHRVIQITALHFFFDVDRNFLSCFSHSSSLSLISLLQSECLPLTFARSLARPSRSQPQLLPSKLYCVGFWCLIFRFTSRRARRFSGLSSN